MKVRKLPYTRPANSIPAPPRPNWEELLKPVRPPLEDFVKRLSDRERDGLLGPVKSVTRGFSFDPAREKLKPGRLHTETIIYDQDGKRIDRTYVSTCGLRAPEKEIYDSRGRLAERIGYNGNGNVSQRVLNLYSPEGWLSEVITYGQNDVVNSRILHHYSLDGVLTGLVIYDGEGREQNRATYSYLYDDWGNWIEQYISSDKDGLLWKRGRQGANLRLIEYYR